MKARKFPGVRCSTLNTECNSLLCLMTMPGRICVAGIAIRVTPHFLGEPLVGRAVITPDCGVWEALQKTRGSGESNT
jgi:hypothetical protein